MPQVNHIQVTDVPHRSTNRLLAILIALLVYMQFTGVRFKCVNCNNQAVTISQKVKECKDKILTKPPAPPTLVVTKNEIDAKNKEEMINKLVEHIAKQDDYIKKYQKFQLATIPNFEQCLLSK